MNIPLREIITYGAQIYEWAMRLREGIRSRDAERVEALLPDSLRSVVQLELGKALAADIALQNRRMAERGHTQPTDADERLPESG